MTPISVPPWWNGGATDNSDAPDTCAPRTGRNRFVGGGRVDASIVRDVVNRSSPDYLVDTSATLLMELGRFLMGKSKQTFTPEFNRRPSPCWRAADVHRCTSRPRQATTLMRGVASGDADLAIRHVGRDGFVQHHPCIADSVAGNLTEPASKAEQSGREESK